METNYIPTPINTNDEISFDIIDLIEYSRNSFTIDINTNLSNLKLLNVVERIEMNGFNHIPMPFFMPSNQYVQQGPIRNRMISVKVENNNNNFLPFKIYNVKYNVELKQLAFIEDAESNAGNQQNFLNRKMYEEHSINVRTISDLIERVKEVEYTKQQTNFQYQQRGTRYGN